jgi:hypothetical protein
MSDILDKYELAILRNLRMRGFAVAIFGPDELAGLSAREVEDSMVDGGWQAIEFSTTARRPEGV